MNNKHNVAPEADRQSRSIDHACPSCFSKDQRLFYELSGVPVNSVLNIPTRERAVDFPRGKIALRFCRNCGFITNSKFNPGLIEYSSNCEESQGYSPTFNEFAQSLAKELVEKYHLHNKDILEIGCGKGEFLTLLCELGGNRGVGFDPAYVDGRGKSRKNNQIVFIKDFYSEKYGNYASDFICCRMTLEHISDTGAFIRMIRHAIGDHTKPIVFFQVPDATRILRDCALEDIYYEHCSYFSPGSLARLFRCCGFDVIDLKKGYGEQYIILTAQPTGGGIDPELPVESDVPVLEKYVARFQDNVHKKIEFWQTKLTDLDRQGRKIVIWGSGSKGVSFLTTLKIRDQIEYVVDINPYRQGTFMAGTGQLVVAPEFLQQYRPDVVIIMNAIYHDEIQKNLVRMRLDPDILTLEE